VALTLAETSPWNDPYVVGWFVAGLVSFLAFLLVESRARDPMIPLSLFRNRTFAVSVIASFFAVFGFSTLIIFLPLWFQIVQGASTTASGYLLFPFLFGLIFSSIAAGLIVSRTGRYKMLLVIAMFLMAIGLELFSNLRADTPNPVLWSWMLIAGLGVGPTMAIFTLIVQNDVDFHRLGTATSDLTLFRQIGTSVGLTVAFTLFRNNLNWGLLHDSIVKQLPAGLPAQAYPPATPPPGFDLGSLTSVGGSPSTIFASVPANLVGGYTEGFHQAFSIAIANSVWIGVGAAVLSLVSVLVLKEVPLRAHFHAEQAARAGLQGAPAGQASPSGPPASATE
jgi:MFS family permease